MKHTRFSWLVAIATMATVALGMDWPFIVRAALMPVAVGLWLATVVKRV